MADQQVTLAQIIIPARFTSYVQVMTEEKSRLVQSGAVVRDPAIDALMAGGGNSFDMPKWGDLENDEENIDSAPDQKANGANPPTGIAQLVDSVPKDIDSFQEIGVRLSRNQSWGSYDLLAALAGSDPLQAISNRVTDYWVRRLQALFIATWRGVSADNGANDQIGGVGDYAVDIAGVAYSAGVTDFSAEAYIDAAQTMGDSSDDLSLCMMHSVVHARAEKNNLIDFIRDSDGQRIATFRGAEVIIDDGMPSGTDVILGDGTAGDAGTYETWLFGANSGVTRIGTGTPKVPTEVDRAPAAASGGGEEILYNRIQWLMHPSGHAYTGTATKGGPANAAIATGTNWNRVTPERKQVKFARLVTRES